MTEKNVTKKPQFIEKKYKKIYKEPYKKMQEYGNEWYKGAGVTWKDHPLKPYIPKWAAVCGNCENDEPLIIAAHCEIKLQDSEDHEWELELYCSKCKKYTQHSHRT